jgi:small subunit ribosomal protein S18
MARKIQLKISPRLLKKRARRAALSRRHCRFCGNNEQEGLLDFKNSGFLRGFLTERGKILPSRVSGSCAIHQRKLSESIKQARVMALLPYTAGAH